MNDASSIGDRYRRERTLGGGGMATVVLAHDEQLDRLVAVKLLAEQLAADEELRARFLREARAAAQLVHPNVVAVYDAGEDDARLYIVMEYVEGETLGDLLARRKRLPPEEAVPLVLQACAGLEHAHAHGLVHRDVKPRNLLLGRDGTLKVADFGIARAVDTTRLTAEGAILGTVAYVAPEQAAGEDVTPAADVYALGAVLYELLAGQAPFGGGTLADLARKQAGEPVTPLRELAPDVPQALEDVVMRALALRPEYRPPTAGALASELADASEGGSSTVVLTPPRRRRRTRGRPLALAAAAAAILFALGLGLGLALESSRDEPTPAVNRVAPIPRAATPELQARNLSAWLQRYAVR